MKNLADKIINISQEDSALVMRSELLRLAPVVEHLYVQIHPDEAIKKVSQLRQAEDIMSELKVEVGKMYHSRFSGLLEAVRAGNKLFDFFSDIFVDASYAHDVNDELLALEAYLKQVHQTPCAPRSFAMTCYHEDDIFGKALRGEHD